AAVLADLEHGAATKAADLLARASILQRARRLEFVHPIVRRAIYADLAPQERAAGHARAAKLLAAASASPEQIAGHLLETSPAGDRRVVAQLRGAAEQALGRGATKAAIGFLRRALDEPPDRALRIDVLVALGSARCGIGEHGGVNHLREALELADDARSRALVARELAVVLGMSGRAGEALALLEGAINALAREDRELSLELEAELAAVSKLGSPVAAVARARLASIRPSVAGETPAERRLLAELAWQDALHGARADQVAADAERALRTPRWLLGRLGGAPQYFLASWLLVCSERFDAADSFLRQAVAEAGATGSEMTLATASVHRSALAYRRGNVREARTEAALAVDLRRGDGWALGPANALAHLVDALIELGEIEQAERALEQHEHGREVPDGIAFNDLLDSRGALRLAQGRNAEALADFREYGRRERDWRARNPVFSAWRSRAAVALGALGEHDQARELVANELALARAFGAPRAIGIALRAQGLLERGEAQLELLTQAVAVLERSSARLEHARALVDLGAATRRQGRRKDAREPLRRGLELAQGCGATALIERAREELQALGDRSRRAAADSSDALTPRERHVAQLAADGLSNPQIAQMLYVSLKTVETHLGHVYQKLGIRSRAQLKTMLTSAA
ncbi:MAG: LuxR C-terminal-related transcriptional regulator, partial [Chloroflexota bacterium]|nr:LuxR C-terminal-related transcriptional regulator [Chloroflexota bacterium]